MAGRYVIEIFYSEEDEGYIAIVPELPGCSAFGETEEEALKEVKVAVGLWLGAAEKEGRQIPKPSGRVRSLESRIMTKIERFEDIQAWQKAKLV